jgi:hypothetical protein
MPDGQTKANEFFDRASASHAEARKLLLAMAVASVGFLFATLTGKDRAQLPPTETWCAVVAVLSMCLATGFGVAAWLADAAWAWRAAKEYEQNPSATKPLRSAWHRVKNVCDLTLLLLFLIGVSLVAFLTMRLLLAGPRPA